MSSSRKLITAVIEEYKNNPCLWDVTHPEYHNKFFRNAALKDLLTVFKTFDKSANLDTVKKKISSMRNCFMKELNKVKTSKRLGKEKHIPKLWYYNKLLFLSDDGRKQSPAQLADDILAGEEETEMSDDTNADVQVKSPNSSEDQSLRAGDPPSPSSSIIVPEGLLGYSIKSAYYNSDDGLPRPSKSRKKKKKENSVRAERVTSPAPQPPRQNYTAYGEHIAEKLRSMPSIMATYCQKIINDAVFMAETNNLDISSHIVTDRSDIKIDYNPLRDD